MSNPYMQYDKATLIQFYESNEREIRRLELAIEAVRQRQGLIMEARLAAASAAMRKRNE